MEKILCEVELHPRYERVKSFYGNAILEQVYDGWVLYSYSSSVVLLRYKNDGVYATFYNSNKYTKTTLRHLREFAKQFGNKQFASFCKLSKSKLVDWIENIGEGEEIRFADKLDS